MLELRLGHAPWWGQRTKCITVQENLCTLDTCLVQMAWMSKLSRVFIRLTCLFAGHVSQIGSVVFDIRLTMSRLYLSLDVALSFHKQNMTLFVFKDGV